jgi:hypothetical protein
MKEAIIVRRKKAVDFRRLAEKTEDAERQRKLLVLAQTHDEEAKRLEETLGDRS